MTYNSLDQKKKKKIVQKSKLREVKWEISSIRSVWKPDPKFELRYSLY